MDTLAPTYTALFNEQWSLLCSPDSMAAVDSPIAYLQALHAFALTLESTGTGSAPKIRLEARRPDLTTLKIDEHSLTALLPQLSIVNTMLADKLDTFLKVTAGKYRGQPLHKVLSQRRYPFLLPFDRAHQECVLGLSSTGKPRLGEISYLISIQLPLNQRAENTYGAPIQSAYEAQRLLSGVSPALQELLTEAFLIAPTNVKQRDFFTDHYGSNETALLSLETWLQRTELSADQTEALLACGRYLPQLSPNVSPAALPPEPLKLQAGAAYVNGPITTDLDTTKPLEVTANVPARLASTSLNRFERLHRMIRLQRVMQVPFDMLDTLLVSAMQCEPTANPNALINGNSLRVLGVFRYLNQHHQLQAEQFAAILHAIPVRAPRTRKTLYDQVFDHTPLPGLPMRMDQLELRLDQPLPDSLRYGLCTCLGLRDTPDSLLWLIGQAREYLPAPHHTLTVLSALYRQTRIAALFGLSVMDSYHLAHLLGGKRFCKYLVAPFLHGSGDSDPCDLLDMLMQMDWLVGWLRRRGQSVTDLHRLLIINHDLQPPAVQAHLNVLEELTSLTRHGLLKQQDIDDLQLPQPLASTGKPRIQWHAVIVQGFLHNNPLLPRRAPKALPKHLIDFVDNQMFDSDATRNTILQTDIKAALAKKLAEFYLQVLPLKEKIDAFFGVALHASYDPTLLTQSLKHIARQTARAASATSSTEVLKHLLLMLPDAETLLGLPVSREVLHTFLLHPQWLSRDYAPGAMLKLTLSTVYLLQRFAQCLDTYGLSQETLLTYLQHANAPAPANTQSHTHLASLLDWTPGEINSLVDRLPGKRVLTLADLDWIIRCREIAKRTGLSAAVLLKAVDLNSDFTTQDWTQTGAALVAAAQ